MRQGKTRFILAISCALIWVCRMSYAQAELDHEAIKAADVSFSLIDSGRYSELWDAADPHLKRTVRKKRWLTSLTDMRLPRGKAISRKLGSASFKTGLPGAPCFDCFKDLSYVIVIYDTGFENSPRRAIETLTLMRASHGEWRLFDYYISQNEGCRN